VTAAAICAKVISVIDWILRTKGYQMKSLLPDQYRFSHKYSTYLNGYLASLLVFGEQNKVYSVTIHFKEEGDEKEFSQLEGGKIADWLEENGYKDELEKMLLRTLYPALLGDLYQFVAEALDCSERASTLSSMN